MFAFGGPKNMEPKRLQQNPSQLHNHFYLLVTLQINLQSYGNTMSIFQRLVLLFCFRAPLDEGRNVNFHRDLFFSFLLKQILFEIGSPDVTKSYYPLWNTLAHIFMQPFFFESNLLVLHSSIRGSVWSQPTNEVTKLGRGSFQMMETSGSWAKPEWAN
jgi:hypothetical protein